MADDLEKFTKQPPKRKHQMAQRLSAPGKCVILLPEATEKQIKRSTIKTWLLG